MIPNYTPEYINKIKENNSNLARALTEEKRKYAYLYTEKEKLDKRVLQLTKKNHDQKKYVDYLFDVLRQTLHYLKDQSTKVEKMINKKADDFSDRMSLFPTPNFLDNSNFNIPSPTPTKKSYEFDTNFINTNRRCNILNKSARTLDGINKESSLINTSIGEDKLMSTSTSSNNASSFEGIAEFGDEDIDCLRDEAKRETFNSCREVNSSPAELLANYNKTVIAIQDMEMTLVLNTNPGRILKVEDMGLASAQNTNTVRVSDTNTQTNNNSTITKEICMKQSAQTTAQKSNANDLERNKIKETSNKGEIVMETNMNKNTHNVAEVKSNATVKRSHKSSDISNHGAIAKEKFFKKKSHTIREQFDTRVIVSNTNENNDDGTVIEDNPDASVLRSSKDNKSNSESAVIQETHNKAMTEEKFDTVYSDILSNKCVEKNSKCLSKTSTIEDSTSETITEVTQINMLALIPNILIDRLNELSNSNTNTIGENNITKQRTDENGNKPGELNNIQLIHTIDDTNITKKRPCGNADKSRKSSETVDEVSSSNKKEKSSKIEKKPTTSKQLQKSSKTAKKGESSKISEISTKSSKTEELNKKNESSTINSSTRLSFKIPKKSNRIKRTASLNINYKEPTIREKMRRD